jgi:hypothetical protein
MRTNPVNATPTRMLTLLVLTIHIIKSAFTVIFPSIMMMAASMILMSMRLALHQNEKVLTHFGDSMHDHIIFISLLIFICSIIPLVALGE